MSKYKLYHHNSNGKQIITENDMIIYRKKDSSQWKREHHNHYTSTYFERLMVGDIALDNGFELQRTLTESELFAELL